MQHLFALVLSCFTLLVAVPNFAIAGAHYVSGTEGLKAATLPPPGVYWRMYASYYDADTSRDNGGDKIKPDFDLNVAAWTNRFIWSTDVEILGGNLVMDIIIPTVYTDISMRNAGPGSFGANDWGVSDIILEPFVLAWHGNRYDAALGAALFLPTGDYNKNQPASPGKGFWTVMLSAGGTLYFDEARSWHASVLSRYEIHTKQEGTRQTHGDDFSFEWGVGKTVNNLFDVGLAGYCYWQVTEDSGSNSDDYKERGYAIGPEISTNIPEWNLGVSLRSIYEFGSRNKAEGNSTVLTLTYRF